MFPFLISSSWVQHRYGYTYIYTDHQRGYNWGSNAAPPEDQDDSILDKLHLPSISMPDISMPDVSMPDVSMPSMSMPSVSMPSLGGKGLFKRKKRQPNPREYIRLHNSKVKKSGKTLSITGATVYYYYEKDPNEEKNDQKVELTADDDDQAESWFETFKLCGCQEA